MDVHLLKMKRKDIENINDDFSDFSLYSPATKIRRLDADLPPIIEEDEPEFPSWIKRPDATVDKREMPATSENVDGAIVQFNIMTTPLPLSPSRFCIDSDILLQIKKDICGPKHSSLVKSAEDDDEEEEMEGRKNTRRNECLAVVPWLQQLPPSTTSGNIQGEMEEDEQMGEAAAMEIEEDNTLLCGYSQQMNENLPQWQEQQQQQQQHCMMIPQYSQMTDSFLQWQLQQQQQQLCMMNQHPPQSSSAPLMQYQWW